MGSAYNGETYTASGSIEFKVDGSVKDNKGVPTRMEFYTMPEDGTTRQSRMVIWSDGQVKVTDLKGGGDAFVCVNSNGHLFRSATACN